MLSLLKSVYQQFKKASTCILLMKQAAPHEKRGGQWNAGLRLDEKKSFISGRFVVYLPPLMLRAIQ